MAELCPSCDSPLEKTLESQDSVRDPGTYRYFTCGSVWHLPQEGTTEDVPQTDCRDLETALPPTCTKPPCWIMYGEGNECVKRQRNRLRIEVERLRVDIGPSL